MSGEFEPFVERMLRRYLGTGEAMLDVGCGPATYRSVCPGRYVGIDLTERDYVPNLARLPDVVGSGDRVPFAAGTFDLVMCKSTLYIMRDPGAALEEFHRVLKPAGRVLIVDYNARTQRDLEVKAKESYPCWTQRQLLRLVRSRGFRKCRLLATRANEPGPLDRHIRPLLQELFGTWAIVLGYK